MVMVRGGKVQPMTQRLPAVSILGIHVIVRASYATRLRLFIVLYLDSINYIPLAFLVFMSFESDKLLSVSDCTPLELDARTASIHLISRINYSLS